MFKSKGIAVRVTPAKPRSTIVEEAEGLRIIIPAKRNRLIILFLGFWLSFWLLVGGGFIVAAIVSLVRGTEGGGFMLAFALFWSVGWAFGAGFAGYTLLWQVAGREVVLVNSAALTTRREVWQFGRSREYDLMHVRDLRAAPVAFNPWDWSGAMQFWGISGGSVAFDYGAATYRFGTSLDEAEAKRLVETIKSRVKIDDRSDDASPGAA